ncbi:amidohydrolase family protein [Bradyrhizobium oligotrophicum]|uniref:amidohydrolase family protein n=1 Tax=Bradyrhizobium oligotrophicum TaxID=44255 RepID=UPI003EB96686
MLPTKRIDPHGTAYAEAWPGSTIGSVQADSVYRVGSTLRHGGVLSFGDWSAASSYSTHEPLDAVENDVIPLDAALRAATIGPAYQLGMEREIGSIEVGKLADLVVLEKNLFEVAPQDIHKTKMMMTVMDGRIRHERKISQRERRIRD